MGLRCCHVKAYAIITQGNESHLFFVLKLYPKLVCLAMFKGIINEFLDDPKQRKLVLQRHSREPRVFTN